MAGADAEADATHSGTRAERYQVTVHTEMATLEKDGEGGRSELDGVRVSAETSRRMACDASLVSMLHRGGQVVGVGRKTRTIPPHIRRALEERDRGCRYPGCGGRFTEVHHVRHWADGGETSLADTVLLCRRQPRGIRDIHRRKDNPSPAARAADPPWALRLPRFRGKSRDTGMSGWDRPEAPGQVEDHGTGR